MATEVNFEWTWTGYVGGVFLGEPEIFVTADVRRDGEVFVTGVEIVEFPMKQDADGKWFRGTALTVRLDGSDDAFSLALFAKIKADLEIDRAFIERAIEHACEENEGDDELLWDRPRRPSLAEIYGAPSRL